MNYTITRNDDGTLTIQRPNDFGGLYPLVMARDQVYTLEVAYGRIATDYLTLEPRPASISIEMRSR